jgi:hypothetical protein
MAAANIGHDSPLAIFITYPDEEYDVGSDVIITLHVFLAGEYSDPQSVTLTVGEDDREIGLTPQDTGIYKGVFTIEDGDLSDFGSLWVKAEAMVTFIIFDFFATDTATIPTVLGSAFEVAVKIPDARDQFPDPGQEVELVVDVTYLGSPVDPKSDTLEVRSTDPSGTSTPITVTRVATGQFQGTFAVPAGLKESSVYKIEAEAEYSLDFRNHNDMGSMEVSVDFFDVWAHIMDVTNTQAEIEIMVLDGDGDPVSGADVDIDYSYFDDDWNKEEDSKSESTDEDGTAAFTIEYPIIGQQWWRVNIEGKASSGGVSQLFDGTIHARQRIEWTGDGGDQGFVISILSEGPFGSGASISMEHHVSEDGSTLETTEVYYYALDQHQVLAFGSETTDEAGKFSIPFKLPEVPGGSEYTDFGIWYQGDLGATTPRDYRYVQVGHRPLATQLDDLVDGQTTISVEPFSVGETIRVTFDHPDADGEHENAFVLWGLDAPPDWEVDGNLEWESWNFGGVNEMRMVPAEWVDGKYVATFASPVFLTESSEIFLYGTITFIDEGDLEDAGAAARITSISPEPPNPPPTAAITTPQADEKHGGTLRIQGTASDDVSLEKVEVRIDGGAWMTADGTTSWSYQVDTTKISEANHTVEVRSSSRSPSPSTSPSSRTTRTRTAPRPPGSVHRSSFWRCSPRF